VALPLKLRERGHDAWVEDSNGVEVIARTHGFKTDKAHEDWCRWVIRAANAEGQPRREAT
jgi:hypothetical protein